MNLYVWLDENGEWQVTHLPPSIKQASAVLMVALPANILPVFIDMDGLEEVEMSIRP